MTCDDARTHALREIGHDGDNPDARAHLATCPDCSDYRRDAQRLWTLAGRAVESCPPRRPRASAGLAAAAAALIVAASVVAWAVRPAAPTPAQDPDAKAEELLKNDPEFRKQVLRTAVEEKARLADFEKKLKEAETGFAEAKALYDAKKLKDVAAKTESVLSTFPYLKLVILDPYELRYKAALLRAQVKELDLTARFQMLRQDPEPGDAAGQEERAATEIRLINSARECRRQLETLAHDGPQPRKSPTSELGGAVSVPRNETRDKLKSIRITIDMQNAPLADIVKYLQEISGLNMVIEAPQEKRETSVSLKVSDAVLEGMMEFLAGTAGMTYDVDRFGIVVFRPRK
jgi:hypothetical protein